MSISYSAFCSNVRVYQCRICLREFSSEARKAKVCQRFECREAAQREREAKYQKGRANGKA